MKKLTLSVDAAVVARAKRYAARRGTSVSRLVETYLDLLSRRVQAEPTLPPVLARLREDWKGVPVDDAEYREHLERKYR